MFSFFQKKHFLKDHLEGFIDIHNHIIYGVDDGAKSLEESIKMLREYIDQGVDKIIATPHYRRDMFNYDLSLADKNFENLKEIISKENMHIQ